MVLCGSICCKIEVKESCLLVNIENLHLGLVLVELFDVSFPVTFYNLSRFLRVSKNVHPSISPIYNDHSQDIFEKKKLFTVDIHFFFQISSEDFNKFQYLLNLPYSFQTFPSPTQSLLETLTSLT